MLSIMLGPLQRNPVSDLAQLMFYHILFSSSKITGWAGLEIRMTMSSLERFFPAAKLKDFSTLIRKNTRRVDIVNRVQQTKPYLMVVVESNISVRHMCAPSNVRFLLHGYIKNDRQR